MSKIHNAYIKAKNSYDCFKRRRKLKYKDFSIISNNCWGGFIYQYFGLKYTSPTIGLFIMESDYVKMLSDLRGYLSKELEFIDPRSSRFYNALTENGKNDITYPVAKLGDIDIFFMHYSTKEEARGKWERRKKRINYDRLLVKMSERTDSSDKVIKTFCELPYQNMICFTANKYSYDCCVQVKELAGLNQMGGDETPYTMEKNNIYNLINELKIGA